MTEQAAAGEVPRSRTCCNSTDDVGHDFTCPTMLANVGVTLDPDECPAPVAGKCLHPEVED